MNFEYLIPALSVLVGVIITAIFNTINNLITKRKERLSQANKLIIEKRLDAHEEIITIVRYAILSEGTITDGKFIKIPIILTSIDEYDKWHAEFVIVVRRVSHLIDEKLSHQLFMMQNYYSMLSEIICPNPETVVSQDKLRLIGSILYNDIIKLSFDVIEEASLFYSKGIYKSNYKPATTINKEKSTLPDYFKSFDIITKKELLKKITC